MQLTRQLSLIFSSLICFSCYSQKLNSDSSQDFYLIAGVTVRNTPFFEHYFDEKPNLATLTAPPTIGVGYWYAPAKLGLETTFYQVHYPRGSADEEFRASDFLFNAGIYYRLDQFKAGMYYSYLNTSWWLSSPGQTYSPGTTIQRGVGIGLGYYYQNFDFEFRKEFVVEFIGKQSSMAGLFEYSTLAVKKNISLLNKRSKVEATGRSGDNNLNFHLVMGATVTGSEESDEAALESQWFSGFKFMPTLGLELRHEPIQVSYYIRRSIWARTPGFDDSGYNVNTQLTRTGFSYLIPMPWIHELKLGLSHVWNASRSQQRVEQSNTEEVFPQLRFFEVQNQAIGLDIRAGLTREIDFTTSLDIYYQAHPQVGTGINRESLRLGLLYNLY